ncbi:rhodanese-like domain-containing protein [Promicromonospora panici]|uniref:rhodanese-like domain-containing protein n=1 Tax=Promicromonospora panici TaxID=2219658 RepID=UPI00101BBEA6|nr:rhodanese-like domain-containing protein [Promicromonospora panici]
MFQPMLPEVPSVHPSELDPTSPVPEGSVLLDVREQDEWDAGHAPGAVHIPLSDLPARFAELDAESPVLVVCHSGGRSARATQWLNEAAGFEATNLEGGILAWQSAGLPVER